MATKLTFIDHFGNETTVMTDSECASYDEFVSLFYRLSAGAGFSETTIDKYISCNYNDYNETN